MRCATACWPRIRRRRSSVLASTRKEARHVNAVDVTKLLLCAKGLRYHASWCSSRRPGMRRGEALGTALDPTSTSTQDAHRSRGTLGRVDGEL